MTLFEIENEILDCIDPDTGEIVNFEKLTDLQQKKDDTIEGVALLIKNLNADAAALKAEKDAFSEREKKTKAKAEKLTEWLSGVLDGQKFNTVRVSVSFKKSEAVKITDLDAIPNQYIVETVTESPDKMQIKAALKKGIHVPGCELEMKNNIQIK